MKITANWVVFVLLAACGESRSSPPTQPPAEVRSLECSSSSLSSIHGYWTVGVAPNGEAVAVGEQHFAHCQSGRWSEVRFRFSDFVTQIRHIPEVGFVAIGYSRSIWRFDSNRWVLEHHDPTHEGQAGALFELFSNKAGLICALGLETVLCKEGEEWTAAFEGYERQPASSVLANSRVVDSPVRPPCDHVGFSRDRWVATCENHAYWSGVDTPNEWHVTPIASSNGAPLNLVVQHVSGGQVVWWQTPDGLVKDGGGQLLIAPPTMALALSDSLVFSVHDGTLNTIPIPQDL